MNILLKSYHVVKKWISRRKNGRHITLYYAVGVGGQGRIFAEMPRRDTERNVWVGDSDGFLVLVVARMEALGFVLPKITWEDAPVELKLSLT
jgi:hypothetical protein